MDPLPPATLMGIAARHVEARVLEGVQAAGFPDLTAAQARIAARIAEGGSRLVDLAEAARVTKQSAAVAVDGLERGGYVRRVPDPDDGRARLILLGERGVAAREVARRVEADVAAEWRAALGADGYAALGAALTRLRPLVDPWIE